MRATRTLEDAMRRTGMISWLVMVAGILLLSSCGSPTPESAKGTLSVRMVHTGLPGPAAIYVTVSHIDVHSQNGNWKTVLAPQTTINLLELVNGNQVSLGLTDLPSGPYTGLRLVLDSIPDDTLNIQAAHHPYPNYLIDESGQIQEMELSGVLLPGIRLIDDFAIAPGQTTVLVLEFDATRSQARDGSSGGYQLKPTIKVVGGTTAVRGMLNDRSAARLPRALVSTKGSGVTAADLVASPIWKSPLPVNEGGTLKEKNNL